MQNLFDREKNTIYQRSTDLLKIEVPNGTMVPLEKNDTQKNPISFFGGCYDENMTLVPLSLNKRVSPANYNCHFDEWYSGFNLDVLSKKPKFKMKKVIFLGAFHTQFGHFILESLSRLWIFLDNDYYDYELIYISEKEINTEYLNLIKLFGLELQKVNRLTEVTTFTEIIIPEMSLRLHDYYHINYKKIIDRVTEKFKYVPNNTIYYLSRANIKNSRVYGERALEYFLAKINLQFLYPEMLTIEELIIKLRSCRKVISISGTSCHNSIFMRDGSSLVCFSRSPHFHPPQIMIDRMKNLKTFYVDIFLFPSRNLSGGPFFIFPTKYFFNWIYTQFHIKLRLDLFSIFTCLIGLQRFIMQKLKLFVARIVLNQ